MVADGRLRGIFGFLSYFVCYSMLFRVVDCFALFNFCRSVLNYYIKGTVKAPNLVSITSAF